MNKVQVAQFRGVVFTQIVKPGEQNHPHSQSICAVLGP